MASNESEGVRATIEHLKNQGNNEYKNKKYIESIASYSRAIQLINTSSGEMEIDSSSSLLISLLTNRAAAYLMLLQYKEANSDCDHAIKLDPTNAKAFIRKATALKGLGLIDQAISSLEQGLQHDPTNTVAKEEKQSLLNAKAKLGTIKDLMVAKQCSMALLQIDALLKVVGSSSRELNLLKIEALLELNRPEEAYNLSNTQMRTAQNGDVELLRLRAACFFALGDLENSVKHLQQALRSDPDNSSVRTYYRKVKEIDEKKSEGDNFFKLSKHQEAIDAWSICINLCKGNKPFSSKLHLNRATALAKVNKLDASIKDCSMALYYNDKYIKAFLRRGESYISLGGPVNISKGIEDYETASELETDGDAVKAIKMKIKKAKVLHKRSKRKDLYAVLGVPQDADENQIKSAYRKCALKYHPDKQANKSEEEKKEAETIFKSIGEAYEILSDPQKKARYDEGVEVEDIDNPQAEAGGGHHHGGGVDPNILFQMFMQQQAGRR